MESGLWITWYDLPDHGREAYLAWLHETYIPRGPQASRLPVGGALPAQSVKKGSYDNHTRANAAIHTNTAAVPDGGPAAYPVRAKHADVFRQSRARRPHARLSESQAAKSGDEIEQACQRYNTKQRECRDGMKSSMAVQVRAVHTTGKVSRTVRGRTKGRTWPGTAQSRMPAISALPGVIRTRQTHFRQRIGKTRHSL